jgi:hypothetical protein
MRLPRVRFTVRTMLVGVAIVAVGCASLPFLFLDPVSVLTIAALFAAISVTLTRGRNWPLLIGAVSLACLAIMAVSTREIRSMLQKADLYRRLAKQHANRHDLLILNIPYFDKHPESASAFGTWEEKRKQWVGFVDYDARMSRKYDRAARYPFLSIEPEPKPWRTPGFDPILDVNGMQ